MGKKNDLCYGSFWPPQDFGHWYCTLWHWLKELPRTFKFKWQRFNRGWADCDAWSIDYWFQNVVPDMLRYLAENHMGVPYGFHAEGGSEKWKALLLQIADDLEAIKRFNKKWYDDGHYKRSLYYQCRLEEIDAHNKVLAGLEAFKEYFYNLWD